MLEIIVFIINIIILSLVINKYFRIKALYSVILSFLIIWILFINVNPYDIYYNKYNILKHIPDKYKPKTYLYNKNMNLDEFEYPVILKPNVCSRSGNNVSIINNKLEAMNYINNNICNEIIIQEFVNHDIELGVLCERNLKYKKFEIISIIKKSSNSKIMNGCYGNIKCYNYNNIISDKLTILFNDLSNNIPNFNVGRYDIKCKDIDNFLNGNFYILEVNGTMGFDLSKQIDLYNLNTLINVPNSFIKIQRWFFKRIIIGSYNILYNKCYSLNTMIYVMYLTLYNTFKCKDWEKLFTIYS